MKQVRQGVRQGRQARQGRQVRQGKQRGQGKQVRKVEKKDIN